MTSKLFALTLAALTILGPQTTNAEPREGGTVAGTWMVSTQITENAPPGVPLRFRALHTYASDGRFIDRNTQPQALTSAGHGEWYPLGKGRFALTFVFFSFTPTGDHAATIKVRTTIQLNDFGDEWSGRFSAQAYSPDGTPLGPPAIGTHSGKRLVNEPLDE
ncbi:MAG: hypothetical protein SFV51_07845 [Bryobacteraceae bacterium]|nr:hypothetical protein [Bryobacteraceae bacterium]